MGAGGDEQRVWEEHQPREEQDSMLRQARERVEKDDIEQDSSTEN
jgi:hypothetical protein